MEEKKEKYIHNSLDPVSIESTETILYQMKKCVCKIHAGGTKGTGFFTKIPNNNNMLSVLITNNHVLGEEEIKDGKIIYISFNNETKFKNIIIDSNRKRYTNEILNVTIIEIKENIDNINDFLTLDNQILEIHNLDPDEDNINYFSDKYEKESIYLLNYKDGKEIFTSYGLLLSITESEIKYKCNTDTGSSGSPILLLKSNKVIGVHYGSVKDNFSNFGTLILKLIFEFQRISNNILVIKKANDLKNNLYSLFEPNKEFKEKDNNKNNKNEIIINKDNNSNEILLDIKSINELKKKSIIGKFNEIENKKSPMKNHEESNISEGKQSRGGIIQFNNLKNNYEKIENKYINKNNNYIVVEENQKRVPYTQDKEISIGLEKIYRLSDFLLNSQRRLPILNRNNNKGYYDKRDDCIYIGKNSYNKKKREQSTRHKFAINLQNNKDSSCEVRFILRKNQMEKGGVVKLPQQKMQKTKFKIRKIKRKIEINKANFTNPKYRDKAAKIIQAWWRDIKDTHNYRIKQIIKIQSAFRGKFVRKIVFDVIFLSFLCMRFCEKMNTTLGKSVRQYVWKKLFYPEKFN